MSEPDDTDKTESKTSQKSIIGDGAHPLSSLFRGVSYNLVTAVNSTGTFIRENTELLKELETAFNFPQDPMITSNFTACAIWTFGLHIYMVYKNEAVKNLKAQAEMKTIMRFFRDLSIKIETLAMDVIGFSKTMHNFKEHLTSFTVEMQSLGFSIKLYSSLGQEDTLSDENNIEIGSGLMLSDKVQKEVPPLYVYAVNYSDKSVTFDDVTKFSVKVQNEISGILLREIQTNLLKLEKTLPLLMANIRTEKISPTDPHFTSVFYLMDQIIKFLHRSHETTHDHEKGYTWAMERVVINTTSFLRRIYKVLRSIIEIRDTLELTYAFLGKVPIVRGSKYYQAYVPTATNIDQGFWKNLFGCQRFLNSRYRSSMFMRAPYRKALKHHFLPVASNLYPTARFSMTLEPVWPVIGDKEVIAKRWFKDDAYMVTGDTFKLAEFPHPKNIPIAAPPPKKKPTTTK